MKPILASLTLLAAAPMAHAASLDLDVTGVDTSTGTVKVAVFDSEAGWTGYDAAATAEAGAEAGTMTLHFDGLAEGPVAIRLFHDVDGDGELARSAIGIPKEPYGFSNDAPVRFGPPKWKAATFTLGDGANRHAIALR